jgi:hypothetical protein
MQDVNHTNKSFGDSAIETGNEQMKSAFNLLTVN